MNNEPTEWWRSRGAAAVVVALVAGGVTGLSALVDTAALRVAVSETTARARDCYMTALLRARAERSTDGVLTAAEAFLSLGDEEMLQRSLHIASDLARRDVDPRARERVALLAARAARAGAVHEAPGAPSGRP